MREFGDVTEIRPLERRIGTVKRGILITEEQRVRLHTCTDLGQLDEWLDRAVTATRAAEVFDAA
jgi:hypothetical protein